MEYKNISFELKDLSKETRTAIIAHAVYDNIDRTKDISRKGMFTKSWQEGKSDIRFFLNHDKNLVPGRPTDFFEDGNKAYTKVYLGTHTLGEDTLKMMDEGIITDASFGYRTEKSNLLPSGIRELKEVRHMETSVLTHWGANPLSKVELVKKAIDIENAFVELKEALVKMENFCRNTTASDEAIIKIADEIKEAQRVIAAYEGIEDIPKSVPEENKDEIIKRIIIMNIFDKLR